MNVQAISFKGGQKFTENGNKYYHANTSLITSSIVSAAIIGITAAGSKKNPKAIGSAAILMLPLLIISAISDSVRNKNNKKAADLVQEFGYDRVHSTDKNILLSNNSNPYYKSNVGAVLGFATSLILGLAFLGLGVGTKMKQGEKFFNSLKISFKDLFHDWNFIFEGLLTSLVVGDGTDIIANKNAKRHA